MNTVRVAAVREVPPTAETVEASISYSAVEVAA